MPEVRSLPVYFTRSEQHRLLAACTNDRDRMLVDLLRYTGGRISEVLEARVGDITPHGINLINLKQGRWISKKTPDGAVLKDASGRPVREHVAVQEQKLVHLPPDYLAKLRQAVSEKKPEDYIITALDSDQPISRVRAWQIITSLSRLAGIEKRRFTDGELRPLGPHRLRHSHAVLLLENGVPITIVQAQLGHKSLSSTQIYSRIVDPTAEALVSKVEF